MAGSVKTSGIALAGILAGSTLVYAGLTGKDILGLLKSVVQGKSPTTVASKYGITSTSFTDGSGSGSVGTYVPGSESPTPGIPFLGTTLPPIGTMTKYFGAQADASQETTIIFAGHPVTINKVLAENLFEAGHAIVQAGLQSEIHDVGGFRTSVGASGSPIPFSMHQFGVAIDINEGSENWHTMSLDPKLVGIMAKFRWFCGENWGGASRDGGHFQYTGGG